MTLKYDIEVQMPDGSWKVVGRLRPLQKILSDPAEKRRLMIQTIIATQAREGIVTTHEQAAAAYDKIQREGKST